jgi:hypothetical protein
MTINDKSTKNQKNSLPIWIDLVFTELIVHYISMSVGMNSTANHPITVEFEPIFLPPLSLALITLITCFVLRPKSKTYQQMYKKLTA